MTHLVGHYMSEAIICGPARCRGCGGEVVWVHDGTRHMGWLHASGHFTCPRGPRRAKGAA